MIVILLRPKSTGEVCLKSTSPFDHPKIHPNYFDEQQDCLALKEIIKFVSTIIQSLKNITLKSLSLNTGNKNHANQGLHPEVQRFSNTSTS